MKEENKLKLQKGMIWLCRINIILGISLYFIIPCYIYMMYASIISVSQELFIAFCVMFGYVLGMLPYMLKQLINQYKKLKLNKAEVKNAI